MTDEYRIADTSAPTGTIHFYNSHAADNVEILRLSKDGIWANPDVPVDDAAKLVLAAIDSNIRLMVQIAVVDMQRRLDTLHAMYQQACQQRDELMDQQRAQVEALRGRTQ